jgi:hypothetical protein
MPRYDLVNDFNRPNPRRAAKKARNKTPGNRHYLTKQKEHGSAATINLALACYYMNRAFARNS